MKSRPRPLRLGSFELLESRAMLAYGGINFAAGTFSPFQFGEQYQAQVFSPREFHQESHGPAVGNEPRMEAERFEPRGEVEYDNHEYEITYTVTPVTPVYVIPMTPVIVFVTIQTPATSQPQYSAPQTNNVGSPIGGSSGSGNSARSQSSISAPSSYSNPALNSASPRSTPVSRNGLDAVTLVTGLTLKRTDTSSTQTDEDDSTQSSTDNGAKSSDSKDRDTKSALPAKEPAAATPTDSEADSNLIELTAEDPLVRGKRRTVRTTNNTPLDSATLANSALRLQRQTARVQTPNAEVWLQAAPNEADFAPVADDLIELIANDTVEATKPTAHANSFESQATVPIEATVGYFRATELDAEQNSPENAQSAAVAAAALPVPAGK